MKRLFASESIFPLAKNCFAFEDSSSVSSVNLEKSVAGLVVIPNIMGNKRLYIGTLLADLCSQILGGFSSMVNPPNNYRAKQLTKSLRSMH
jgi:hypothetical protein